jgi:SET domain-containing protein
MIHPDTELRFINDQIGYGVVATKFIPKGTITWALDKLDRIFTTDDIRKMEPVYKQIMDKYTYRNPQGNYVFCWDIARYVNHSSISNCVTTAYEFEIAVRDIQPGEELTDDYGYLNLDEPFEVLPEPFTLTISQDFTQCGMRNCCQLFHCSTKLSNRFSTSWRKKRRRRRKQSPQESTRWIRSSTATTAMAASTVIMGSNSYM